MRRNFGYVLLGLGGLFLAVAVLALVWAPGVVKKTPLDVDSNTVYEGEGGKINTATGEFDVGPVYAIQRTKSDSEASSDDTVVFVETSCLVVDTGGERVCVDDTDPDLLTADIDIFATDRTSALAVDDENLPENAGPHEGLVNKWPFDVEKKTYPYWDGLVGRAGRHGLRGDRGDRRPRDLPLRRDGRGRARRRRRRRLWHLQQRGHRQHRSQDRRDREGWPGPAALPGLGHPGARRGHRVDRRDHRQRDRRRQGERPAAHRAR